RPQAPHPRGPAPLRPPQLERRARVPVGGEHLRASLAPAPRADRVPDGDPRLGGPGQVGGDGAHPLSGSASRSTSASKRRPSSRVIGPGRPSPTLVASTFTTGRTPRETLVRNASVSSGSCSPRT